MILRGVSCTKKICALIVKKKNLFVNVLSAYLDDLRHSPLCFALLQVFKQGLQLVRRLFSGVWARSLPPRHWGSDVMWGGPWGRAHPCCLSVRAFQNRDQLWSCTSQSIGWSPPQTLVPWSTGRTLLVSPSFFLQRTDGVLEKTARRLHRLVLRTKIFA